MSYLFGFVSIVNTRHHRQLSLGIVIALLSGGVGLSVFKKTPEDGEDDTEETSENNA